MTIRIETERLVLRPLAACDLDAHISMMQHPSTAEFLSPSKKPQDRMDLWRQFASYLGHWEIREFGFFAMEEKATGAFVGRVGPWMPDGWPGIECGWAVCAEHWGKGYAPEAAIASVRWIFEQYPELDRIISVIDPMNANSQAVARKIGEQKSGEVFEFLNFRLDVWSCNRAVWLDKFGPK